MTDPHVGQALEATPIRSDVTAYEQAYLPQKATVDHMLRVAGYLASAGITPRALDTPEKVLGAWLKGIEMQIPPMLALQHIYIVDGKAGISAELQLSLIRRAGIKIRIVKQDDEICIVEASRVGKDGEVQKHTDQFTYTEARAANLTNKFNWKSYRRDMLRARATTRCLRFFAPDVTHGCMLADELEAFRDGLSDLPAGAGQAPAEAAPPKRIDAPDVKASSRSSTGDTRVRGEAHMQKEPEADAEAGEGERADEGGSDAGSSWRPGPECFGSGGKPKGIADARRLEGWRAFVTGTLEDDYPRQLGDRVVAWWKEGWRAADAMSADATVTAGEEDGEDQQLNLCREGALSFIDGNTIKDCPYPSGSEERFYFMTGYQAAAMAAKSDEEAFAEPDASPHPLPDDIEEETPREQKPAASSPALGKAAREGLEASIADGFETLGLDPAVAKDVISRRYDSDDLASLSDLQVQELDRLLNETLNGDNDGTWMDPGD